VQPYPVPLGEDRARQCADLLDAFRIAREESGVGPVSAPSLSPSLERAIERRVEKSRRRVGALRRQLDTAEDPEAARAVGNLILARFGDIPRGATRAHLIGFDGTPVEVELDPTLTVDRNASKYFERAARVERARLALPGKIREAEEIRERWQRLLVDARDGAASPEAIVSELGLEVPRKKSKVVEEAALPYRTFRSSGGLEIRVGRGAKHNDDLTFRHSAPTDIWLHVRQNPGAHVILRWNRDERPPKKDLGEAATLAALHSPARGSSSVPVAWTRRKYVRKPRGAPPGTVAPDRTETLFVQPDPALLKLLRVEEAGLDPAPGSA
jgi:predicted ribosome quality control (RQC) complex YloA/Tae2 family protein